VIEAEARALGLPLATRTILLAALERSAEAQLLTCAVAARHGALLSGSAVGARILAGSFDGARDAVGAAVEARADGVTAAMAVHTGGVVLPDHAAGPTLDRGIALLALSRAGQILISTRTCGLIQEGLPSSVRLVDRGIHRLPDLARSEHVWELTTHDEIELAELQSLSTLQHNLPAQFTPLICRHAENREVDRLLQAERLVTIIGPGGVGKTRFALAVAASMTGRFPGGVWWTELAAVRTGAGVVRAALAVLRAAEAPQVPGAVQVAAALGDEPSLLALDNCEHLVDDCAQLVARLLAANSSVTVLATSREPLGVPGEVTWHLRSLETPAPDAPLDAATLYRSEASRLFVERAVRAQPSLVINAAGVRAIGQICGRLDGIPLAIELASARCRHADPVQIGRELDDRFRVLTGGSRTADARQQTLAASIEWSHDRLDRAEQAAFRRLGVFTGPFSLEAAQTVVAGLGDVPADEVIEVIRRLVDKSMVVAQTGVNDEPRYRLLETLRAFALERAAEAGELRDLRELNARWWSDWLDGYFDELHSDAMVERVEEAHDNLIAALDWSVGDAEVGLCLLARLGRAWWAANRSSDGLTSIERLLTTENADAYPRVWVEAANFAAQLVWTFRSRAEGNALSDLAEQTAATLEDEYLSTLARYLNSGVELVDRIRELAHERGDRFVESMAIIQQSRVLSNDDPQHADDHLAEAQAVADTERSSYLRNEVYNNQAHAARDVGHLSQALAFAKKLADSRSTVVSSGSVWLLGSIGLMAMDEEALRRAVWVAERRLPNLPGSNAELEQARARLRVFLGGPASVTPDFETIEWMNGSLWFLCREAIDAGETERALSVVRAQAPPSAFGQAVLAVIEAAAGGGDDRWHEALRLATDNGLRLIAVDALEGLAVAAARRERWTDCLRLFDAAQRLRDETGYRWRFRFEREVVEPARAAAVSALGKNIKGAAAEAALEWREAAAYAARARGRRQRPRHGWDSLTPTELQIAELVAEGHTNPQIGQRLLMGRATVKSHLEHVFTKLNVSSRAELAALAARRSAP
jgi:predicted ATPase/DNA-binding CsgD family transcriptional regulator